MSLNNSNHGSGIILFRGERLLIFYNHCEIKIGNYSSKNGSVYLTSHRIVFINKDLKDDLQSVSMPFVALKNVDIKQPIFGANRVEGHVSSEPNGGFQGQMHFSFTFKHGGAIEFGQALLEAGRRATRGQPRDWVPTYQVTTCPPAGSYYAAPPPAYAPPYADPYYNFVPRHDEFQQPDGSQVYMHNEPPPYPGACPYPTGANGGGPPGNVPPYQPSYGVPQGAGMPQPPSGAGSYSKEWEANQPHHTGATSPPAYYSAGSPHDVYVTPGAPMAPSSTNSAVYSSEPSAPPAYCQLDDKKTK